VDIVKGQIAQLTSLRRAYKPEDGWTERHVLFNTLWCRNINNVARVKEVHLKFYMESLRFCFGAEIKEA